MTPSYAPARPAAATTHTHPNDTPDFPFSAKPFYDERQLKAGLATFRGRKVPPAPVSVRPNNTSEAPCQDCVTQRVYVKPSNIRDAGLGLFACGRILQNEWFLLYTGVRRTQKELEELYPGDKQATYWCRVGQSKMYIDASEASLSSMARYANDCTEDLAKAKVCSGNNARFVTDANKNIWLEARRDIAPNSEIYVSYGEKYFRKGKEKFVAPAGDKYVIPEAVVWELLGAPQAAPTSMPDPRSSSGTSAPSREYLKKFFTDQVQARQDRAKKILGRQAVVWQSQNRAPAKFKVSKSSHELSNEYLGKLRELEVPLFLSDYAHIPRDKTFWGSIGDYEVVPDEHERKVTVPEKREYFKRIAPIKPSSPKPPVADEELPSSDDEEEEEEEERRPKRRPTKKKRKKPPSPKRKPKSSEETEDADEEEEEEELKPGEVLREGPLLAKWNATLDAMKVKKTSKTLRLAVAAILESNNRPVDAKTLYKRHPELFGTSTAKRPWNTVTKALKIYEKDHPEFITNEQDPVRKRIFRYRLLNVPTVAALAPAATGPPPTLPHPASLPSMGPVGGSPHPASMDLPLGEQVRQAAAAAAAAGTGPPQVTSTSSVSSASGDEM